MGLRQTDRQTDERPAGRLQKEQRRVKDWIKRVT
jgi:hypothetical protein